MPGKAIWKPGFGEIAKASRGNTTRGIYGAPYEPSVAGGQCGYFHKTESFMKNRGQQKCFDKALYVYTTCVLIHIYVYIYIYI